MPRFAVYSDLHYELGGQFEPPPSLNGKVDGVILAGDIATGPDVIKHARHIAHAIGAPTVLVAGNHEFYDQVLETLIDDLRAQSDSEVQFLDGDAVEIAGVRILGATLWTDFALNPDRRIKAMHGMHNLMNDFRWIKRRSSTRGTRKVDPLHLVEIHKAQLSWLSTELAKPFDGPTIVVTHHAPSRRSLDRRDDSSLIAAAYASNLDDFIEGKNIDVWIHGHIHENQDYMIGNTRIIANPYGYKENYSNPDFKPGFVLEV